jgi:hypothetical protein
MDDSARMSMDEASARRVLLAQAIETADREGKLLTPHERGQVDRQARDEAIRQAPLDQAPDPRDFLDLRARTLLAVVGARHPDLMALQQAPSWQRWMGVGLPLAALVLGVLTDVIGNPHRVDLVSLPLLGIVAWNLAVYLALLLGLLMPGRAGRRPLLAGLGRWTDGERALHRRGASLRTQVTALFHMRWFGLTEEIHVERFKRVLHLSAAAWAVGVILSLLVRGLVVEYRVGWESTFLGPAQVHAILSVLRLPALLLFPFSDFTVQDVAAMRFSAGGGAVAGAHWVFMYVALLLAVVVIPRLVLAAAAGWREHSLARAVALDVRDPYFERIISLLNATRVQLGLVAHRPQDRAALLRVLAPEPDALPVLVGSDMGDVLRLADLPLDQAVPHADAAAASAAGWAQRLFGAWGAGPAAGSPGGLAQQRDEIDVVLHVTSGSGDLAASRPLLAWLGKPVVTLVNGTANDGALRDPAALPFDAFARCWVQEHALLDAIARRLPASKAAGFARIARAWEERNAVRLQRAMGLIAEHLLYAARQVEEVRGGALTVKSLLPAERQAQSAARQAAMEAIVKRLDASAAETFARLRHLHGVDADEAQSLEQGLVEKFRVRQPIDSPQAGMAGAATGAAMGASVDLMVGGLTLGAATALGALVGGSAAFVAAAWKNRASPGGATLVQLSDDMLRAMTQAALLRYLAVTRCSSGESQARWNDDVATAVEARRDLLAPYWIQARTQPNPSRLAQPLARELDAMARSVLDRWYPRAPTAASAAP